MRVRWLSSHGVSWNRFLIGAAGSVLLACSASGNDQQVLTVTPGSNPDVTGQGGGTTEDPNNPIDDVPDLGVEDPGSGPPAQGCQQAQREFTPKIPTVYLLVDRSASMFDIIPETGLDSWTSLRGGVLQVMQELQGGVRFGFAAFSGQNQGVNSCMLDVPLVPPDLNNYDSIANFYNPLGKPANPQNKETPTLFALSMVAEQLRDDATDGEKYILFVTDGEPDYCNDGNALCPPDSVVGLLQSLAAGTDSSGGSYPPIKTLVFGVESPNVTILPSVLQGFANAGAGEPVAPMLPANATTYDPFLVWDQCFNGDPSWLADFQLTGKPAVRGTTIGTYTEDPNVGGTAPLFRPDPTDQAALADEFRTALASVKSCTFDLGEDGVKVDLTRSDLGEKARVIVNGAPAPFDAQNGWHMLTETTVQLEGDTCEAWRDPLIETSISFDFPCDIFVPR